MNLSFSPSSEGKNESDFSPSKETCRTVFEEGSWPGKFGEPS